MEIGRSIKSILLTFLFAWHSNSVLSRNITVKTFLGNVRGTQVTFNQSIVNQYLGIPFAKPPVGDLRFKTAVPVEAFNDTYVADKMPPGCIQFSEYPFPGYSDEDEKSEDCLYLNIWTPEQHSQNQSVLFWIYGGGFTIGSNRQRIYEGQALAATGGVVVVTTNYRVGVLGFLTSGTKEAPGNYGIYDILEALRWVNQYISAFGGDPKQVTLVGESAGSWAIGLLCVSPVAKGLFHRVIMQSGSPAYTLADNSTSDNVALSQKLAEAVGCANDSKKINVDSKAVVNCLKKKNATELAKTMNSFNPTSVLFFYPQYGDENLPNNARSELIDGNFHNVDVLIGTTAEEGSILISTNNPEEFGYFGEKDQRVNKTYGKTLLNAQMSSFPDLNAVIEYYLGTVDDDDYDKIRYQVYTALGDYMLLCPTVFFAESYSRAGNVVHYYHFTHRPSTTPWAKWMGSVHFEEIQFIFGLPLQKPRSYTSNEVSLSRTMIEIWTNFVKTGSTGVSNWPNYSRENPEYMDLNTRLTEDPHKAHISQGPHKENCDFFRNYFGFQ